MSSDSINNDIEVDSDLPGLQQAIALGNVPLVKQLIQLGHNVEEINYYGYSPLDLAAEQGHLEIMEILLDSGARPWYSHESAPIFQAAQNGQTQAVKLLIERGGFTEMTIDDGYTLLMEAVITSNLDCVKILVEAGADINDKTRFGETAISMAQELEDQEIYEYLIQVAKNQAERN
ncbi:MAG: ankyrin repeat domain-containing protein [Spirulinaceae cyanobacterium]